MTIRITWAQIAFGIGLAVLAYKHKAKITLG